MIVTYLGHQGWSFGAGAGHVLLDPIFRSIGNAGVQLPVWPDSEIRPEALGKIGGLVLSHEHSDHFDIDTLYRMPYRGDIYVSNRSSRPMVSLLEEIGYNVQRFQPYQRLQFPGLVLTVLPLEWSPLEPDAYGFLAQSTDGTSFFTSVDGMPHDKTIQWLRANCPKRSADNFTNNYMEPLPELTGFAGMDRYATGMIATKMISGVEKLSPERVVLSGQGWSYPPKYSNLNHRFFNVTHQRMLPILGQIYPEVQWEAPAPGTQIALDGGARDGALADFVVPRKTTNRDYDGYTSATRGEPWSRVRRLPEADMARVVSFVTKRFGQMINAHAPELLLDLFELSAEPDQRFLPTVSLRLRDESGTRQFVLDPGWLEFVPAPAGLSVRDDVAGGVEIWASDLGLLAEGREEAYLVYETAVRRWSNAPQQIGSALHVQMFSPFAPRFQPEAYERTYRARLAEVGEQSASVEVAS